MSSPSSTSYEALCSEFLECFDVEACSGRAALVSPRPGWRRCFRGLASRMARLYGVQPKLVFGEEGWGVVFLRVRRGWGWVRVLLLLAATIVAVALAGYEIASSYARFVGGGYVPGLAVSFLVGLLGPLAIHESGHYTAARMRDVPVSPPLFIPAPPPKLGGIGTFGAIILMRGVPYDRDSLALVGISGPLLGFVAGVVVALIGMALSPVLPPSAIGAGGGGGGAVLGFAPLALLLIGSMVVHGEGVVVMHPLAFAAFIVFLVTFLNLLPIGWLDGGHVVYAVFGERVHRATSMVAPWAALIASLIYPQLLVLAVFTLLAYGLFLFTSRGVHPGVLNPLEELGARRAAAYAAIYAALLVLTAPVPLG